MTCSDSNEVWVFAEVRKGCVDGTALECVTAARRAADAIDGRVAAVLLGSDVTPAVGELRSAGVERIYVGEHPELETFRDEPYTAAMEQLVKERAPRALLFGATSTGRSLAPRLAARLRTGLCSECTDLEFEDGSIVYVRPVCGGNAMSRVACPEARPEIATIRPKAFARPEADAAGEAEVVRVEPDLSGAEANTVVVEYVEEEAQAVRLEEADIIVSGGRGLGKPENFELIRELASVLGAAVGASRAAVDAGWIPYAHQVGQTGKTVSPKVYVAVGISGAIQHLAGMQTSDIIVAINKNPDAPIFKVASYGVVGDLFDVVPALVEELKRATG